MFSCGTQQLSEFGSCCVVASTSYLVIASFNVSHTFAVNRINRLGNRLSCPLEFITPYWHVIPMARQVLRIDQVTSNRVVFKGLRRLMSLVSH